MSPTNLVAAVLRAMAAELRLTSCPWLDWPFSGATSRRVAGIVAAREKIVAKSRPTSPPWLGKWAGDESWLDHRFGFDTVRSQWDELLSRRAPLPSDEVEQRTNAAPWIIEMLRQEGLPSDLPINRGALIATLIQLRRGLPPPIQAEIATAVAEADAKFNRTE